MQNRRKVIMKETLSNVLMGSFFTQYKGFHVYAWKRDNDVLYVGRSENVLSRIIKHDVIGKCDALLPTDLILLYKCATFEDMTDLEEEMIYDLKPRYNRADPWSVRLRKAFEAQGDK
jgi:hypothetical protein